MQLNGWDNGIKIVAMEQRKERMLLLFQGLKNEGPEETHACTKSMENRIKTTEKKLERSCYHLIDGLFVITFSK